ncbi:16S rRNA (cytosine(1402)-N(4))-methyltransferase [Candidatus Roizmanbacteria bacterium RIFCSPHIGHO2_02_FULL_40_13b]|uniref:Ribosomal RNA small subunit methyltransferase H n=1 Tax=Candidatus Roizmanbacteria bacterium RIFCSPHIGHO2_01_FULL_39_24 TaxID=1802032 RepID=A0A1F7GKU5_9BACT|nr:MAG: 16S rRNA (cytosine(1402)-N(4))-methyltransferase [Candidatus Roizmanbacteria bacterium RIFCSPHIGHO2_01_FULL_39_24]OGK28069.1 MAG: 16S rRNA (cytosine(1402)-N(4))-methyltransferase [Candidatus Roizmanbacteria bacterium RIFCSPHIGHO2_02_FULL_40_13b]OGK49578.1 MAG: 16S rRNA (cytosine(1402)-N(4))-methyltransferase [Candidatus Roizmanbacteria bacterium RIFCSPLOWO2_01_FULL_40_32]OGK57026.1 MAG: 16S rRNA (cytosine(1402)-N(4))-methyltransferase [Candidatus Roizmanbacteria bacterium RIFCSPLOWO2_02_
MHTPVYLNEVLEGLQVHSGGMYIDGTYGEGGHGREISRLGGKLLGIDLDEEQVARTRESGGWKVEDGNLKVVQGNYADIEQIAKENDFFPVDGVLLDLGLSMDQLNRAGKGLSFKKLDEPLDMRIQKTGNQSAADLVNASNTDELYEIFTRNSEEIDSWEIALSVNRATRVKPIKTVGDLIEAMGTFGASESIKRRIFQALRIEVNHEFENIEKGIEGGYAVLKVNGRMAVITFHSLEDRLVKQWARKNMVKEVVKHLSRGDRTAKFESSAVLRIFEKKI